MWFDVQFPNSRPDSLLSAARAGTGGGTLVDRCLFHTAEVRSRRLLSFSLCPHIVSSASVCLCPNVFFVEGHQSSWTKAHPNELILTNYICNGPISK